MKMASLTITEGEDGKGHIVVMARPDNCNLEKILRHVAEVMVDSMPMLKRREENAPEPCKSSDDIHCPGCCPRKGKK
jgi:hypothetical protein